MQTKYVPAKQREERERRGGSHYGRVSSNGWGLEKMGYILLTLDSMDEN